MSWINLSSVTVSNGSKTVTINSGLTTNVKVGDALLIGNEAPVEISGIFATQLILRSNWPNPTATNAAAAVMPTSGEFTTATQALREATNVTQGNFAEMEKWWTELGTVTFKAYDNSEHVVRTAQQMDADVQAQIDETQSVTDNMASLLGAQVALSQPDLDIPFIESGKIVQGYGNPDQLDVSAVQNGSVMVELPTKSVNFSRASSRTHINKSREIVNLEVDEIDINSEGVGVYQSYRNESLYSEDFSNGHWNKVETSANKSTTESSILPGGTFCSELIENTNLGNHNVRALNVSVLSNGDIGWSFFAKDKTGNRHLYVALEGISGSNYSIRFDPSDGSVVAEGNVTDYKVDALPDGWFRYWIKAPASDDDLTVQQAKIALYNDSLTYQGDGVSGIFIDGAQLTSNSPSNFPYVKTTSATAFVGADVCSVPMRGNIPAAGKSFTLRIDCSFGGHAGNRWGYDAQSGGRGHSSLRDANAGTAYFIYVGTSSITIPMPIELSGVIARYVLRYDEQTSKASLFGNGQKIGLDLDVTGLDTVNLDLDLIIGKWAGGSQFNNGNVSKFGVYHRALSDAEVAALGVAQ